MPIAFSRTVLEDSSTVIFKFCSAIVLSRKATSAYKAILSNFSYMIIYNKVAIIAILTILFFTNIANILIPQKRAEARLILLTQFFFILRYCFLHQIQRIGGYTFGLFVFIYCSCKRLNTICPQHCIRCFLGGCQHEQYQQNTSYVRGSPHW